MKISKRFKREVLDCVKATLVALVFWLFVCIGLAGSTCVHNHHIAERCEVSTYEK